MEWLNDVWNVLQSIGNVVGVLSFIIFLVSAFLLWNERRQYKRRLDLLPNTLGQGRPAALAVGIGSSVKGQVEQFIKQQNLQVPVIDEITRTGMVEQKDIPGVLNEFLEMKSRLTEAGVTELHLFYKGPVTIAAAIGAMVDNWVPTIAYSFNHGTYTQDLVISKQTILGK